MDELIKNEFPLVCIVAISKNNVIGDGEKLLWNLSGDLVRLKKLTMGNPLIMGRKTYDSIGFPLPGRANIVLTKRPLHQKRISLKNSFHMLMQNIGHCVIQHFGW